MSKPRANAHSHTPRDTYFGDFVSNRKMPSMGQLDQAERSKQQNSTSARFKTFAKKAVKSVANSIKK